METLTNTVYQKRTHLQGGLEGVGVVGFAKGCEQVIDGISGDFARVADALTGDVGP